MDHRLELYGVPLKKDERFLNAKCPKCGAAMSTVMRRRAEVVETFYECPACIQVERKKEVEQTEEDNRPAEKQ